MSQESKFHMVVNSSGALEHTVKDMPVFEGGDVPGWHSRSVDANGIDVFMFKVEPNAEYPIHTAPGEWIGYFIKGSGTLMLEDPKTKEVTSTPYEPGDVIYFGPDTPHGWKNGPEPSATLFIKVR